MTNAINRDFLVNDVIQRLAELCGLKTRRELAQFCTLQFPNILTMNGEQAADYLVYTPLSNKQPISRRHSALVSYVYCLESELAAKQPHSDQTWLQFSFAQYWLGVTVGAQAAEGAVEYATEHAGRQNANKRFKGVKILQQEAIRLAKEGNYKDRTEAACVIAKLLTRKAKELRVKFDSTNVERVYEWLKKVNVKALYDPSKPTAKHS